MTNSGIKGRAFPITTQDTETGFPINDIGYNQETRLPKLSLKDKGYNQEANTENRNQ